MGSRRHHVDRIALLSRRVHRSPSVGPVRHAPAGRVRDTAAHAASGGTFVGTAGWSVPRASAHRFPGDGTHLAAVRPGAVLHRDQLVVPPRPHRDHICAVGRVDTGRVAVRGEAASHNHAPEWIAQLARAIRDWPQPAETWCIFDNTASGCRCRERMGTARSARSGRCRTRRSVAADERRAVGPGITCQSPPINSNLPSIE